MENQYNKSFFLQLVYFSSGLLFWFILFSIIHWVAKVSIGQTLLISSLNLFSIYIVWAIYKFFILRKAITKLNQQQKNNHEEQIDLDEIKVQLKEFPWEQIIFGIVFYFIMFLIAIGIMFALS